MPGGRPKIEIDKEQFERLCSVFCSEQDIANTFKCSPDTIDRWCKRIYGMGFAESFKIYSAKGKTSLRAKQFQIAMQGNCAMLIWLGKQYLGQKDNTDFNTNALTGVNERLSAIASAIEKSDSGAAPILSGQPA